MKHTVLQPAFKTGYWIRRVGVRKTLNVILAQIEHSMRRVRVRSKPYYYFIDPCSYCNLRCPLCASGMGMHKRQKGIMGLDEFEVVLEKIKPFAITIALHNWGEPLLNPDIYTMIRKASNQRIETLVSSNLSIEQEHLGERIVNSGLTRLIVSLDGATEETYQKYRRGGSVALVFNNIRQIVRAKEISGSRTPSIEWQYLVFKHNESEITLAENISREMEVDRFVCRSAKFPYDHYSPHNEALLSEAKLWMPTNPNYWEANPTEFYRKGYLWRGACYHLYRGMSIAPDGSVSPCCYDYSGRQDFGNLLTESLLDIWNNIAYQSSRNLFRQSKAIKAHTICGKCFLFQKPA